MSKTRLPAIRLNEDFFLKPRNLKFIAEHGSDALTIILFLWVTSSKLKKCKIRKDEIYFLNFPIKMEKTQIETIIKASLEVGLLEEDEENYYNSQIVSDFKAYEKKKEIYKSNIEKRWNKSDTIVSTKQNDLKNKSNVYVYVDDNNINKNSAPDLPPEIDGRKQCKNGKFVYLSEIEKELLISNYASEGIEKPVISEAIFILSEHIEKNINSPNAEEYLRKGQQKAFEMLSKSWVKDEARKKQKNKIDLETSQKRADYRRAVNATEGRARQNNSPPKGSQVADLIKNLSNQKAVA